MLSFQSVINTEIIEMFYIFFLSKVFYIWCVFLNYSTSKFGLATI